MASVTGRASIGRRAMASWRTGPPSRTIRARSWSLKDGEKDSTGSETLSTSRASLSATSRGIWVEAFRVTASARRTISAASAAMTRRISAALTWSSSLSGSESMILQSL
jgi:hypothetical protein